jgi:hypothetical protein
VPGNQLAAWAKLPLVELTKKESKASRFECTDCGNERSSTIHLLLIVQQQERFVEDDPYRHYNPCPATCSSHDALARATSAAVKADPSLKSCRCPYHGTFDYHLARAAGHEKAAKWMWPLFYCVCPSALKSCWCGKCCHFQKQQADYYTNVSLPGLQSWHFLFTRDCPDEHLPTTHYKRGSPVDSD